MTYHLDKNLQEALSQCSLLFHLRFRSKACSITSVCDFFIRKSFLSMLQEPAGAGKEAVLAWIAAAAGISTYRTAGGESKGAIDRAPLQHGCSDGFVLGLLGLCLLFCKPFLGGDQKFLDRLDPSYYSQHAYRCELTSPLPECALATNTSLDKFVLYQHP